jgi:hypothetical protein
MSQRAVAGSLKLAQGTVSKYLNRTRHASLTAGTVRQWGVLVTTRWGETPKASVGQPAAAQGCVNGVPAS